MFVLFDQSTPVPIRPFLKEHTVQTTAQRGWDKLKNGELLKAAEDAGFDVGYPRQKYPLPAEFDGSHDRTRRAGQSAMANTAPAYGARRRCRERGEAGQLHGSRNTRTLTPAPERRRRSLPSSYLAALCVSVGSALISALVLTGGLYALLSEKLLPEATQGDCAPQANPAKVLFAGF
jgi:hypothetical protein